MVQTAFVDQMQRAERSLLRAGVAERGCPVSPEATPCSGTRVSPCWAGPISRLRLLCRLPTVILPKPGKGRDKACFLGGIAALVRGTFPPIAINPFLSGAWGKDSVFISVCFQGGIQTWVANCSPDLKCYPCLRSRDLPSE